MNSSTLIAIQTVFLGKPAQVETQSLFLGNGGDFNGFCGGLLRQKEDNVSVIRCTTLRMGRNVGCVGGREGQLGGL